MSLNITTSSLDIFSTLAVIVTMEPTKIVSGSISSNKLVEKQFAIKINIKTIDFIKNDLSDY